MKHSIIISIYSLIICFSCNVEDVNITPKTEYSILFIGNSLTYTNNLPQLVSEALEAKGNSTITTTTMLALPNYGLEDHWNDGAIQNLINTHFYDYVIIQQGPSSQVYGKESLLEYGAKIKEVCDSNNSKLAFFMVWPSRTNYQTFQGVITNYRNAANATNAILCPVGEVWKSHFDATDDFSYYGSDGFHPSPIGSKVAANIIVETLNL